MPCRIALCYELSYLRALGCNHAPFTAIVDEYVRVAAAGAKRLPAVVTAHLRAADYHGGYPVYPHPILKTLNGLELALRPPRNPEIVM